LTLDLVERIQPFQLVPDGRLCQVGECVGEGAFRLWGVRLHAAQAAAAARFATRISSALPSRPSN
jgi:hypothetical protein